MQAKAPTCSKAEQHSVGELFGAAVEGEFVVGEVVGEPVVGCELGHSEPKSVPPSAVGQYP